MSGPTPDSVKAAINLRANGKRKMNMILKQSHALLDYSDGIPHTEFSALATRIREQLDILQTDNDWVITLKCQELESKTITSDELEALEEKVSLKEEKYISDLTDDVLPIINQLIKTTESLKSQDSKDNSAVTRMAKLKFPTFSGDMREYSRFKELFLYFSRHLKDIECHYQLVESMQKENEKKKIKACANVKRAWEILDEAYGDRDRLLEVLIHDIESMDSYDLSSKRSNTVDLKAMERFVEGLQSFATQVESIGLEGDLNGRMLLTQVRRRLPEEHRIQFLQSVNDAKAVDSVPGLVKWLHSLLVLLQKSRGPTTQQQSDYPPTNISKPTSSGFRSRKSISYSTMSPGKAEKVSGIQGDYMNKLQKCPLHPNNSSHYIKGCHKFRTLNQGQKFDIMNSNGICHRCGHNNCIAGKRPYNYEDCQFIANCQIPTCGMNTHFTSICPRVYGTEGYRHYDKNFISPTTLKGTSSNKNLNVEAREYQPMHKTSSAVEYDLTDDDRVVCALPTIMCYLRYGSKKILVRVLLDTGSQISLIREGIISKSSDFHMQDFCITTVGGETISRKLRVVEGTLESLDGSFSRNVCLSEIKEPCGKAPVVTNTQLRRYCHLDNVEIVEAPNETVDILLGVENGDLLITEEHIRSTNLKDPVAARCPLGWYVQGGHNTEDVNVIVNFCQVSAVGELEEFLGIERMGLEPKRCKCNIDDQDRIATESMQQSVMRLKDGVYQIGLPWIKSPEGLPNNYNYAVKRLSNLEKQFKNRPFEWKVYCQQIQDQLERGVARHVPSTEVAEDMKEGRKMWFLPHFAVKKDSETTPVRIVYDGKARYQGHSLNDYLAKGQNMNSNLFEVALRFRENEIGIIADITKMFQVVKVTPDDARYHRYFFRQHPEDPVEVYELTTVTFGDKPSPTAATIALRHVVMENAPDDSEMLRVIKNQFYVDDLSDSLRSAKDASYLKKNLTRILQKGGFIIRKWLSNEQQICDLNYYPVDNTTTVLGTKWNLIEDTLQVKEVVFDESIPTKRNILKQTASYYDVFGMLSGILIRPKMILQNLWRFDVDWDTPINPDSDFYRMLKEMKRELQNVDSIKIDRCLIPNKYRGRLKLPPVSLHGFSDASEDAMGVGIWLRWSENDEAKAELSFVCARARLTPLKQTTIPRKELQALLLLSRLMLTVKNALRIDVRYMKMWTDSMTVISWLKRQSKSFRSYVSCRIGEITSDFDSNKDIAYVPTDKNIIDSVSRGCTVEVMQEVIKGPQYLQLPPMSWPKTPKSLYADGNDPELKKFHIRNAQILAAKLVSSDSFTDPKRFSSWSKLIMITARILSLKDLPKNQWLKELFSKICQWPSMERIKEAELYWIRQAQKGIDFKNPHIMKLSPFYDDKECVYRVGGRIGKANISYDLRHPYLLPKDSYISQLIAQERHRHSLHGGHHRTAFEIRKQFWLIGDINICRKIVRECVICRRHRGKEIQQKMADLPEFRLTPCSPPFKTTLIDYFGPLTVKISRNVTAKGYCAVFTCAVTRAVHLTCVQDLTTPAFIQALERFVSIRGSPALIICDNATYFRGAHNEIRQLYLQLDKTRIQSESLKNRIEWKFGPPSGPHHQGAVERIVQEVKKSLRHLAATSKLSFTEWETVLCQISGLINNRPLTAMSSSPVDEPPITPNHFLIGRGSLPCPQIPCEDYHGNLRKRRELCNSLVDEFWRRWMINIHKLSPRHKWLNTSDNLKERDIVVLVDKGVKRGQWKIAEVLKCYSGDDGLVRVVKLRFSDGHVMERPVTKLIQLMKNSERTD